MIDSRDKQLYSYPECNAIHVECVFREKLPKKILTDNSYKYQPIFR